MQNNIREIPRRNAGQFIETRSHMTSGNILLDQLPADLAEKMSPFLRPVNLARDTFLYQEEDSLDHIYFPEQAVISEFKMLEDGRMVEIAVTGREGAVGLAALLSKRHIVMNSVQVSQSGSAQKIDAELLEKLFRQDERLRVQLTESVDSYINQISQRAICNMFHSVKERLCMWLLLLQDRCGRRTLSLTHEQIARVLGVYRPSVTCIAQELRTGKLIDYSRGGISLRNRSGIEESCCSCYFELNGAAIIH